MAAAKTETLIIHILSRIETKPPSYILCFRFGRTLLPLGSLDSRIIARLVTEVNYIPSGHDQVQLAFYIYRWTYTYNLHNVNTNGLSLAGLGTHRTYLIVTYITLS